MNKIKVIDLLNMISKGEEVPKKIKYLNYEYEFNEEEKEYQRLQNEIIYGLGEDRRLDIILDEEVKIIEEPQEHKIPEKINWKEKESMAGYLTKDKQIEVIAKRTEHLKKSINKIIDYLEVNNEKTNK